MLKKRLLGAAVLLSFLSFVLPSFLTGAGDVLSLRDNELVPRPPEQLLRLLEQQQRASQVNDQASSSVRIIEDDGTRVISRQISTPQLDETGDSQSVKLTKSALETETSVITSQQDLVSETAIAKDQEQVVSSQQHNDSVESVSADPEQERKKTNKKQKIATLTKEDEDLIGKLERQKRIRWAVQVGAFSDVDNVQKLVRELKNKISDYPVFVQAREVNGKKLQVVFIGPILDESVANQRKNRISNKFGIKAIVKTYDKLGLN